MGIAFNQMARHPHHSSLEPLLPQLLSPNAQILLPSFYCSLSPPLSFAGGSVVKNPPAMQETQV